MESSPSMMTINNCPGGIPEWYLYRPLALEVDCVQWEKSAAKVTVVYQGCEKDTITAFYLPDIWKMRDGTQFKRVVLFRNNFESDWDYDCNQELILNNPVTRDLHFQVEKAVSLVFLSFEEYRSEYNWVVQQTPSKICVLY